MECCCPLLTGALACMLVIPSRHSSLLLQAVAPTRYNPTRRHLPVIVKRSRMLRGPSFGLYGFVVSLVRLRGVSQKASPSDSQPSNQPVSKLVIPTASQSVSQLTRQSVSPSINWSIGRSMLRNTHKLNGVLHNIFSSVSRQQHVNKRLSLSHICLEIRR